MIPKITLNICPIPTSKCDPYSPIKETSLCKRQKLLQKTTTNENRVVKSSPIVYI